MFIIDDLLLAPAKSFFWLVRELQKAAEAEVKSERDRVMRSLQSLHMRLEAGQITEDEFEQEEARLLDRLDELDGIGDETERAETDEDDDDPDPESDPAATTDAIDQGHTEDPRTGYHAEHHR